jgi:cell division protein FtsL
MESKEKYLVLLLITIILPMIITIIYYDIVL